jgi:hypothetical protein
VDGQRQYPADPDRWYAEHPEEDLGRVPGQRSSEAGLYNEDAARYPYVEAPYTEAPPYAEPGYPEQQPQYPQSGYPEQAYPDAGYGEPTYAAGADTSRRRPAVRPRRVGKRSGLEMPEADATDASPQDQGDPEAADGSARYRAERIDRQALRRDAPPDLRGAEPQSPAGGPLGVGGQLAAPMPPVPQQTGTTYGTLQGPTQSMPAAPPAAVYLSRRPGVAALLALVAIVIELILFRMLLSGESAHTVIASDVLGASFGMAGVPMVALGVYGLSVGAASASGPNAARAWLRTPLAYLPVGLLLIIAAALAA